jgi:hypothetical protein
VPRIDLGRLVVVVLLAVVAGLAHADTDATVKQYAGRVIISPDAAPTMASELPAYVKANAVAGDRYELIKGSPWKIHLVGVLSKDPGAAPVQLLVFDLADKEAKPLVEVKVTSRNRIVISQTTATTAAGFESGKTYAVRLMQGKMVLAKAELTLRN